MRQHIDALSNQSPSKKLNILFLLDGDFKSDSRAQKMVRALSQNGHQLTICHLGQAESNDSNIKFIHIELRKTFHFRFINQCGISLLINLYFYSFVIGLIFFKLKENSHPNVMKFMHRLFDAYTFIASSFSSFCICCKTIFKQVTRYIRPSFLTSKKSKSGIILLKRLLRAYGFKTDLIHRKNIMFHHYNLVHANEFTCLSTAKHLKKHYQIPFIYDSHEFEIGQLYQSKISPYIVKYLEKQYIHHSSEVITVSDAISLALSRKYSISLPHVIYNSPSINLSSDNTITIRSASNLSGNTKIIAYVGGLAPRRGLFEIIESLKYLEGYSFVHLSKRKTVIDALIIKHAIKHNVVHKIHLLPSAPHDAVVNFIRNADVGLLVHHNVCKNTNYAMPNKLFEMVFANIPIVYSKQLDSISQFMENHQLGVGIDEVTPEKIAKGIQYACLKNCLPKDHIRAQIERHYGWEMQAKNLLKIYDKIGSNLCVE